MPAFEAPIVDNSALQLLTKTVSLPNEAGKPTADYIQPPARKLCVRHQRMADEGTNLKLQQALDALPVEEREAVSAVWSNFSSSPHPRRALILHGLLTMCCFSQLSLLSDQLAHLIRLDPSPGICEQHIGQKCLKCGWGLPILEKRRMARMPSTRSPSPPMGESAVARGKRVAAPDASMAGPPSKRQRRDGGESPTERPQSPALVAAPQAAVAVSLSSSPLSAAALAAGSSSPEPMLTRPWKDVYCERLRIERNWRRGRCTVRTLKGHTDGVMCLQFDETLSHPAFPVLITGSYDRTARVWNLETGTEVHCLTGHTRAVRALQFDAVKLITGSMDHTMKVWNWRTGQCLRTLEGHTEGVVCLNFDSTLLASGSVDTTVKVWNLKTGECFTLRGHLDWVNAVQLWDLNAPGGCSAPPPSVADVTAADPLSSQPNAGKMLFSASDDGTIRLWDLALRSCVRIFKGHVGQVQSLKLLTVDEDSDDEDEADDVEATNAQPSSISGQGASGDAALASGADNAASGYVVDASDPGSPTFVSQPLSTSHASSSSTALMNTRASASKRQKRVLISGSLDNTIRLWDIDSGKATKTLFGHIEGVWAVASDKLRLVSGSHDRTIKVWVREEGRCMATLVGHRGAVTCLALGEDKIVSGSDDGDIRLWNFYG
ncbi:quinon protein alcohol dehydrogenase-like superfamily [Fomitopsis serialis]|uniref:quinon protein alcohol dehydrogenase-like superfamily n=1 Tax=Fomitopsis serialis TaxID=139415 RepID=UPI002008DA30|nr:quinon protein alcohol dehydrogenase-like superfamily [Neoantrodia serialis]KAH9921044.1 quinon protein alcohol dehydrogenase-like superfamily [Neoantrodia serialis]